MLPALSTLVKTLYSRAPQDDQNMLYGSTWMFIRYARFKQAF